jgi:hypothetical protein
MRKILIYSVFFAALFAVSAVSHASMYYEMDAVTAASMRLLGAYTSSGDTGTLTYVGYNPGGSANWVYGADTEYNAGEGNMTYAVGFSGEIKDNSQNQTAWIRIGLDSPNLTNTVYQGFLLPVANDDDDTWRYRAYVTTTGDPIFSDWTTGILSDSKTNLLVLTPDLDYSTVTSIGFEIEWLRSDNGGRIGDYYNTSVVPVPGAALLGLLGIGAAGLKLRRFA